MKIHYDKKVIGGFRFIDFKKTFQEIFYHLFENKKDINKIYNFFMLRDDYQFCFANFRDINCHPIYDLNANDMMLAKYKERNNKDYVLVYWINGMSCSCRKEYLNIKEFKLFDETVKKETVLPTISFTTEELYNLMYNCENKEFNSPTYKKSVEFLHKNNFTEF